MRWLIGGHYLTHELLHRHDNSFLKQLALVWIDLFYQRESVNRVPGFLIKQGALPLDAPDLVVRVVMNEKVGFEF